MYRRGRRFFSPTRPDPEGARLASAPPPQPRQGGPQAGGGAVKRDGAQRPPGAPCARGTAARWRRLPQPLTPSHAPRRASPGAA